MDMHAGEGGRCGRETGGETGEGDPIAQLPLLTSSADLGWQRLTSLTLLLRMRGGTLLAVAPLHSRHKIVVPQKVCVAAGNAQLVYSISHLQYFCL